MRIGHRPERDKRITTHVGLVARAFGAEEMLLSGRDSHVEESLADVAERWGGDFASGRMSPGRARRCAGRRREERWSTSPCTALICRM